MPGSTFAKTRNASLSIFIFFALVFLGTGQSYAQVAGATLSGTVKDASGAIVPGAQISIKNSATGVTRNVSSDSAGFYTAPNLLPGTYEVTVTSAGFATAVLNGITLTVGAQQMLNPTLQVGQISQQVEVTTEAPTVQLASSTLSAVVEAATVVGLPLNGRSWTDLASLQPGVSGIETQIGFGDSGRGNRGFGAQLSISGSRPQQNNYRLDGISINDYANGGPGSVLGGNLGVDAVEEFSVMTSSYSAEYGKTSGGVVNAISRAGTNQFHGSGFEFLRNNALDARNFFDPEKIPAFHRNQFGASAGGPIRKDHTFFFGAYEGIRQSKGVGLLQTVPSLSARGIGPDGNPTVATACLKLQPTDASCTPNQPLPGPGQTGAAPNPDPVTHLDTGIQKWLGLYPLPNMPSSGDVANFKFVAHRVVREDYFTTRIDHHFSDKDSIFGTYMFDRAPFTSDEPLGIVLLGSITKRQIIAMEETHTFSPTLVNTVRLGYNRDYVDNNKAVKALNPLAADPSLATVPGNYASGCQCPDGITLMEGGLGGAPLYLYRWNSYQVYDDAFLTKGLHSLKFGFSYERDEDNQTTFSEHNGTYGFGSMQALLTNAPTRLRVALPGLLSERGMRDAIFGAYIQDDYRVRPSLTLNLGLRYEMSTVPSEVQGKISNLYNITDAQPHCGTANPACAGTGPYFLNPTLRNFAPRVGFAWDPFHNGKTAVRGGFGVFDSLPMLYQLLTMNGRAFPYFQIGNVNACGNPAKPPCLVPGDFPAKAFSRVAGGKTELGSVEYKPHRNYVMQWNLDIQHEISRDLTATVGYVGSHGVHQPFRADDADMVLPTLTSAGYLFPNPVGSGSRINENAGSIRYLNWAGSSSYDALEVGVAKKLSNNFSVQGSFTWAKSIDTNSGVIAGDTFSNSISSLQWFDLKHLTRALSDFNIGRTLVINATWLIPSPKSLSGAVAWPLSGWQLSTIIKANDGVPFSALFGTGGDPTGTNTSDDYAFPNRIAGCNPVDLNFRNNPNGPLYVNTNCFAVPTAPCPSGTNALTCPFYNGSTSNGIGCDQFPASLQSSDPNAPPVPAPFPQCFNLRGNSGRNIMTGPGLMNLDVSIFKNNPVKRISENFNVQFRAEFFNVLNHANFNVPDLGSGRNDIFDATGAVNSSTAGLLGSTTTDPREIQFAVKLTW